MSLERLARLSLEGISHGIKKDGNCVVCLCWDVEHNLCSARYYLDTDQCYIDGVQVDFEEMVAALVAIRNESLLQENSMYGPKTKPKKPKPKNAGSHNDN